MIPPLEFLRAATKSRPFDAVNTSLLESAAGCTSGGHLTAGPGSPHPVEPTPVASSGPGPASPADWLEDLYDQARAANQTSYPRGTLAVLSLLLWTVMAGLGVSLLAAAGDRLLRAGDNALYEDET